MFVFIIPKFTAFVNKFWLTFYTYIHTSINLEYSGYGYAVVRVLDS